MAVPKKKKNAYQYFQSEMSQILKDDKSDASFQEKVVLRWKQMNDTEKEKYNQLALKDKERYEAECRERDEIVYLEREKKRMENNTVLDKSSRSARRSKHKGEYEKLRKATRRVAENRKKKVVEKSAKRILESSEKKRLKSNKKVETQRQKIDLENNKQMAADARLEYLLSQSDIFEHFGAGIQSKGERKRLSEREEDESMMHEVHDTVRLMKQPSNIVFGTMRQYQIEGLNWIINLSNKGINGILADEMGLGKTLQTISMLGYLKEYKNISGPHIVIVPKSTLSNWMAEFKRWCPSLRTLKFHGNKDERNQIMQDVLCAGVSEKNRKFDVCITTFEMCCREKGALGKFAWRYLVIDEAHRIKNEASQFSKVVRTFDTEHRLLLTGTPLQNNLHELWALLNFLLPDIFSSAEQFDEWFNLDVDDDEAKKKMINQLHKVLHPFMLRRLKADVEKTLLPKKETLLFVEMTAMQKQLYKSLLLRDMNSVTGNSSSRTALLNIVMQLRKCCGHPYLFEGQEDRTLDAMGEHVVENCGKLILCDKLLKKLKERGSRVLIFSQMTRVLDILEDFCRMRNYSYCRIDGQTTYQVREDSIDAYNAENSEKFVFLLSTRAGGLGINLYTADTVILYDSDWNPQADLQAQDRAHRIGQKKQVNVYRLVTGNSVEEKIVERAQQKLKLDAMVVQQGRLQDKNKNLSKNEMLEMIRFGADKVFRSTETTITDDDIDAILAQGEQRTEEMNKKLQSHDKGDLLDFKLDGGSSAQQHNGVDYSQQKKREDELQRLAQVELALALSEGMGKRERRPVTNYTESNDRRTANAKRKKAIPKSMRLPRMEDWQFFPRSRLHEIFDLECDTYLEAKESGEPLKGCIPKDLQSEKKALLQRGFGDWTKAHFLNFVKLASRFGRENLSAIAREMNRPLEEIQKYSYAFWKLGPTTITDFEKYAKSISKGESKQLEVKRLAIETSKKVSRYENPWDMMTIAYQGKQGKNYIEEEDRILLCLVHKHGYGAWDKIKDDISAFDRFQFDYYLKSRNAVELGRRCDTLMRICEKDNADYATREDRDGHLRRSIKEQRDRIDHKRTHLKKEIECLQQKVDNAILGEAKKMQQFKQHKRDWSLRQEEEKLIKKMYSDETVDKYFVGQFLRYMTRECTEPQLGRAALSFCKRDTRIPVTTIVSIGKRMLELV